MWVDMTTEEKAEILRRCSDDPQLLRAAEAHLGVIEFHQMVALRAVANAKAARAALSDALDLAEEGWAYADEYYRKKWDYEERLAELRKAVKGGDSDGQVRDV